MKNQFIDVEQTKQRINLNTESGSFGSIHLKEKFQPLSFNADPDHDLTVLLESARLPQTWPCLLTNAFYLSGAASFFIRIITKQYPVVCINLFTFYVLI